MLSIALLLVFFPSLKRCCLLYLLPVVAVTCRSKTNERYSVFLFDTIDVLFRLHVGTQIYRLLSYMFENILRFRCSDLLGFQRSASLNLETKLTRALLGGGGVWTPPSGFSRIAKKRRRAAPPGFHPPYPPSFPQLLWKFRPKAMWGQVTRSGQVTQLQNNFPIAPRLQCFRESYETFGIWWGHQCLQNVYLGFLISVTSGQVIFATSPL